MVSLTDAAVGKLQRADQGRDQSGDRPARLRLLRRLLRLPLRDDARGRADARGPASSTSSGIKVYVDGQSVDLLQGSQIDYVDTLMGAGFTVNNPNAVAACGCGSSFRTADDGGAAQGLRPLTHAPEAREAPGSTNDANEAAGRPAASSFPALRVGPSHGGAGTVGPMGRSAPLTDAAGGHQGF